MDLGLSGLASGFDWRTFVDKMVEVQRAPQQSLLIEQSTIEQKKNAYSSISTQLSVLQNRLATLKDAALFDSRLFQSSNETVATVAGNTGTALGSYVFNIEQLATSAKLNGSSNIGLALSESTDVSGVILNDSGFSRPIANGTITVNGAQVTVDASGSLQDLFTAIETATSGKVTASYDPGTDRITLTSASGELVLGSPNDSSNFLSVARLYNNGTSSTSSTAALGGIKTTAAISKANFSIPIDDGGDKKGIFKVNGVEISYRATVDSLETVIARINQSDAGVIASYDRLNDRITLTNRTAGDVGISVVDVTGNFATATGLAGGELAHGKNLLYSVNGGETLISTSNSITEESSGINGLTVKALTEGTVTVSVSNDNDKIKTAIKDFITEFNKTQSLIDTSTASSTDEKGKVTSGILADESDADSIASTLRSTAYGVLSGFAETMNQLADIGISTNGNDNSLNLKDEAALDAALTNNLLGVKNLFTDSKKGIAVKLNEFVEKTIGDNGALTDKDTKLARNIASIDTQISDMERIVQSNREALINSFVQMEAVQAQINQQLQFLAQRFGTATK